jgi:polysaccharide export outer membrane protein
MKIANTTLKILILVPLAWAPSGAQVVSKDDSKQPATVASSTTSVSSDVNSQPSPNDKDHFIIGNEDVLAINVWKEPELSKSVPVRSDGKISLPLVGELHAAGKTPKQLEGEITTGLRAFMSEPEVTVMVQEIRSKKFNVLGRVMHPGAFQLAPPMTVLDALAVAGGFQDFAKSRNIYVLRRNSTGQEMRLPFNYKQVIRGEHSEQNILLEPRDTIVVP